MKNEEGSDGMGTDDGISPHYPPPTAPISF